MQTLFNLRDMGNLNCADNLKIKPKKLYRSGVIRPKNKTEKADIEALQLDVVVDFRTPEEIKEKKDWLCAKTQWIEAPVFAMEQFPYLTVTKEMTWATARLKKEEVSGLLKMKEESYRFIPFAHPAYDLLFEQMDQGKTILFHCTQGKDRTGWAAAMIESAFGRSYQKILEEYLKSNDCRKGINQMINWGLHLLHASFELIEAINYLEEVHPEMLRMAWETVLQRYGSMEHYLQEEYHITPQRLAIWKKHYLEAV